MADSSRHRPRIFGNSHMAASAHYLGAQVANDVLEAGGNAVDAGVAGGMTLCVVQGEFVNFAGVAPIILKMAGERPVTVSGLGPWPKLADPAYFVEHHGGTIPPGIMRTVVPGAPDAWLTALGRYGTMSFGEVASHAVKIAREGYAAQSITEEVVHDHRDIFAPWPANVELYFANGRAPRPGQILKQPVLADTLDYMANQERIALRSGGRLAGIAAARDAFYKGDIARTIVAYHEANGGWLRADDLAEFKAEVEQAQQVTYKGVDVYGCGFWCQGPVLLQTLRFLDKFDLSSLGHNSPQYIHLVVEALKLSFADREAYYGDPRFINVPADELLSEAFASERRKLFDPAMAWEGMPPFGKTSVEPGERLVRKADEWAEPALDTSYICAVDSKGNMFSATPSDDCVNTPIIPGTGLAPSSRGQQSWVDPSHPCVLAPGKRPRLTPSPALMVKEGEWSMPMGSPGNDVQPQAMLQVLLNVAEFGMSPQHAIEQPRFATYSFPATSVPHEYHPGRLTLEGRIPKTTAEALSDRGHQISWWPDWDWRAGCVCAVYADERAGVLEGAADIRRPGGVRGR